MGEVVDYLESEDVARVRDGLGPFEDGFVDDFDVMRVAAG